MNSGTHREGAEDGSGAYGLRIFGAGGASRRLVGAGPNWQPVQVLRRQAGSSPSRRSVQPHRVEFPLGGGGRLVVERAARRCVFTTTRPLPDEELVHPYLAPAGATFAWWEGREAFHGGGFGAAAGIWAVVGDRGSGKSSLLAWLALQGFGIVCDDMLVVDRGLALAGPRCVDLRGPAARHLGVGELLTIGGLRERWRVPLEHVPPERPLLGWVFLAWGDKVEVAPVGGADRLVRLAQNRSMMVEPLHPGGLLDLAALPAWRLTRPKDWACLPEVVDRLAGLPGS